VRHGGRQNQPEGGRSAGFAGRPAVGNRAKGAGRLLDARAAGIDSRRWPDWHRLEAAQRRALPRYDELRILKRVGKYDHRRVWLQIGTLGGGNHFIELCLDEEDRVWVMLHSGSRNVGKTIGETAISMAREIALKLDRHLPDRDLAWLDEGTVAFDEYIEGLRWRRTTRRTNRALMMHSVLKVLASEFGRDVATDEEAVNCHHNYASLEEHLGEEMWVTRKGAVSARAGELGIIPGSMGARSFIVRGKGNADSYCSCSHGAGRRMSRGAAKRNVLA